MTISDLIGGFFATIFTIMVLLYAFGDNAFFRLVLHIFIGVAAGYAAAVAVTSVLIPRLSNASLADLAIPLFWVALLITKLSSRTAVLGNPASALLVGVGAAVAVGGAIQGTLLPQLSGAGEYFSPARLQAALAGGQGGEAIRYIFNGLVILVGTVTSLVYFHFGARYRPNQIAQRNRIIHLVAQVGQAFIAITLGVIFAGVYNAALLALIERFDFVVEFILRLAKAFL